MCHFSHLELSLLPSLPPSATAAALFRLFNIYGLVGVPPPFPGSYIPQCAGVGNNERKNSRQGDISNLDVLVRPFIEELDGADFVRDFPRQHLVAARVLDLDLAVVGHDCG